MEKTWRWFGKKDKITLSMLRQIGVEGIVTALHDVPNGQVWTREAIRDLREYIESYGMRWSVVESLPVCESIKYGGADRDQLIENYKESLHNLSAEGIHTICYNFMPVLDWARTDLDHPNPNGTTNLYFSYSEFFDMNSGTVTFISLTISGISTLTARSSSSSRTSLALSYSYSLTLAMRMRS